ncbi:2'-5' RNA ligase family protein [Brevundimonas sp. VNH65]|uniref:2'-5' RNA ligase family protein n=1 Tax=Brevundimonas sp. VNH65 TaxID=3400917 RepID=UPI003C06A5DE
MIVVDTSALMAILLNEEDAPACIEALDSAEEIIISAGTLAEALIVAGRRGLRERMAQLIEGLGAEIAPVTESSANAIGRAYEIYGKGRHRAALNYGDCFAYESARSRDYPLLFVGEDFAHTDVVSALPLRATGVMSGDLFGRDFARDALPQQIERLFFGLMLPRDAAREAVSVLRASRDEFGLRGHAIREDRLHITLIHVGDYAGMPPQSVVDALRRAGDSMAPSGFDVALDRVSSFSGAPDRHPHVLLGERAIASLKAFRNELMKAVVREGVKPLSRQNFTPHVTLSYADRRLPERPIRPIAWRPTEFMLIHSEVGRSIYNPLGRWSLH